MNTLDFVNIIFNVVTITISLISLTVSILSVRIKKPLFLNVDPIEWNDSFEMLYEESKFMFRCANYSGQDMLLHLKEGYVQIPAHLSVDSATS